MSNDLSYITLTDENFRDEVLERLGLMIVQFFAASHGSRHIVAPILDEVMAEYNGRVPLGKIDVDENSEMANLYRIREFPTLLFFRNGVVVDFLIGIFRKKELRANLKTLLAEGKGGKQSAG